MKKTLLFQLVMILAISAFAQQTERMLDPLLNAYLERNEGSGQMIELFVHGNVGEVESFAKANGGIFKRSIMDVSAVRVPVSSVRSLAALEGVTSFEFSLDKGQALNDSMRVHNKVVQVHNGTAPLQMPFDGSGTVVGIIDTGIELYHPDFRDENDDTRVVKLWDQNLGVDVDHTPANYGYGQVWDSTEINAGLCPHVDQVNQFGHGSNVTGTAAGNGRATGFFQGVATGADLLIVSNSLNVPNWHSTIVDAVEWIFNEAEILGKPCVINISLGSYYGSHDGLDAAALMIDDLIDQSAGRALVCAAGNSGALPGYHLRTEVDADTSFTWFTYRNSTQYGYGAAVFELWADTADFNNVEFAFGADQVDPSLEFKGRTAFYNVEDALVTGLTDTLKNMDGDVICPILSLAVLRGGQYNLKVIFKQPVPTNYLFRFESTGSGVFDVWSSSAFGTSDMISTIPEPSEFPAIVHYVLPDDAQSMVSSWACSPMVLTVGNYRNESEYVDYNGNIVDLGGTEGEIVPNSSSGPTRDGRTKPDVAATGDVTLSSGPFDNIAALLMNTPDRVAPGGFHSRGGGTSIAAPGVTGTVALYFEKCNEALWLEVMDAITGAATNDAFTGATPNNDYGFGKLNAFDALVSSNYDTELSLLGDEICDGDSILVSGPTGMNTYEWSHGETEETVYLQNEGEYFLVTRNLSGCIGYSDTLNLLVNEAPDAPILTQNGNELTSSPADHYLWYLENNPLEDDTLQSFQVLTTGNYFVQITNEFGCTANSDTLFILSVGVEDVTGITMKVFPNPTTGYVHIEFEEVQTEIDLELIDRGGRVLLQESLAGVGAGERYTLDIGNVAHGIYTLRVKSTIGTSNTPLILH